MDNKSLHKLILYIIDYLQDLEAPISTIRIIKYLYLIDYENYIHKKELLTTLEWIRYLYGPYFLEWKDIKRRLSIDLEEQEAIGKDKISIVYKVFEEQRIDSIVDWNTENLINRILDKWSFEDIEVILDYIYTDTEPMQFSLLNEKLDFSKIRTDFNRNRTPKYLELNKNSSNIIQYSMQNKQSTINREISNYTKEYYEGMISMDKEDAIDSELMNKIKIVFKANKFFSSNE